MTECNQESFTFTAHFSRRVEARFTGGRVSSDGGALFLREVDRRSERDLRRVEDSLKVEMEDDGYRC